MATVAVYTVILEKWETGHNAQSGEVSLIIHPVGGNPFAIQMPGIMAQELGRGLIDEGTNRRVHEGK